MYDADLTSDQMALLFEIGEFDPKKDIHGHKKRDLQVLLSKGYAEARASQLGSGFKLSAKAVEFLRTRGLGVE